MEHNSHYVFFSAADGNLLIRILIAQVFAFVIGTIVAGRIIEMIILFGISFGFTGHVVLSAILCMIYGFTFIGKDLATLKWPEKEGIFDVIGKISQVALAIVIWSVFAPTLSALWEAINGLMTGYKSSLIMLGYLLMLWPTSNLVKLCLSGINQSVAPASPPNAIEPDAERGGRIIGMFERAIILTLVLLGEYSAIGFLITGKSIIRFAQTNEKIRSEYVLVGTMASYAVAILVGVLINWLLKMA